MKHFCIIFFVSNLLFLIGCTPDKKEIGEQKAVEVKSNLDQQKKLDLTPEQQKALDKVNALLEE